MKMSMTFEGGRELAAALNHLSQRARARLLREVLVDAAEPMRASMASLAPSGGESGPPDLKDSIIVAVSNRRDSVDSQQETVAVGPKKGIFWGHFQEFGTEHHAAQPFARPAFDQNVATSLQILRTGCWRELAAKGIGRSVSAPTAVQGEV